ncbi:copper chaperone [Pseudoalteromonas piscicida]|uniref:Copper chaperone n=2 Tax=Pseudoalteromonas TaxID=53246 RepID=A0AAQ2EW63_PSEO7|nr:heavy-metal-associated domain-containing protein [Pseudoalteromonas piscicida]TMN80501.1 copper chaperone [Pseudoalteromonas flavipulchra]KJY85939.1 copper chaperone CopZ [Pseudoalteromonas piscicida]TMN38170.1 copper chaperone [Pseudoalteromonas piscicida]TMN38733.1 copper chaperone [Pseudoalteromonas piscicida]TMN47386.1 copper chaperone [Pseudoalteromonas piscicida]
MLRLRVEKMVCGHCVKAITEAIQAADSQAQVNVRLDDKIVEVSSTKGEDDVIAIIRNAGYSAELINESFA